MVEVIVLDTETREMFAKILEGQNELKQGQSRLQEGQSKLEEGQSKLEVSQSKLESEVKRNSIKLESIEKDIKIIVEVHTSHNYQNEISFKNTNLIIEDKTSLIETAVKSVSLDVKDIKESIEILKEMTGKHEVEINILKRRVV